eukprot:GHVT01084244.1.p1 GENE.GHVT01084244.1~~GHVT01084244.1.p1  ORF type:complete len:806 (+),score=23.40 GHVT01084244.1:902-3319(+)
MSKQKNFYGLSLADYLSASLSGTPSAAKKRKGSIVENIVNAVVEMLNHVAPEASKIIPGNTSTSASKNSLPAGWEEKVCAWRGFPETIEEFINTMTHHAKRGLTKLGDLRSQSASIVRCRPPSGQGKFISPFEAKIPDLNQMVKEEWLVYVRWGHHPTKPNTSLIKHVGTLSELLAGENRLNLSELIKSQWGKHLIAYQAANDLTAEQQMVDLVAEGLARFASHDSPGKQPLCFEEVDSTVGTGCEMETLDFRTLKAGAQLPSTKNPLIAFRFSRCETQTSGGGSGSAADEEDLAWLSLPSLNEDKHYVTLVETRKVWNSIVWYKTNISNQVKAKLKNKQQDLAMLFTRMSNACIQAPPPASKQSSHPTSNSLSGLPVLPQSAFSPGEATPHHSLLFSSDSFEQFFRKKLRAPLLRKHVLNILPLFFNNLSESFKRYLASEFSHLFSSNPLAHILGTVTNMPVLNSEVASSDPIQILPFFEFIHDIFSILLPGMQQSDANLRSWKPIFGEQVNFPDAPKFVPLSRDEFKTKLREIKSKNDLLDTFAGILCYKTSNGVAAVTRSLSNLSNETRLLICWKGSDQWYGQGVMSWSKWQKMEWMTLEDWLVETYSDYDFWLPRSDWDGYKVDPALVECCAAGGSGRRLQSGAHASSPGHPVVAGASNWHVRILPDSERVWCYECNPRLDAVERVENPHIASMHNENSPSSYSVVSRDTFCKNFLITAGVGTALLILFALTRKSWQLIKRKASSRSALRTRCRYRWFNRNKPIENSVKTSADAIDMPSNKVDPCFAQRSVIALTGPTSSP